MLDRLSRPRKQRFARVSALRYGYRVDEVDLVSDKVSRYLETGDALTVEQVRAVAFRMQRGGYREAQVDAVLAGVLVGMFMLGLDWWMGGVLGIGILATATAGDLGESMIKRDLGIKDMSSWLPGHGGVLDRLDSILPSAVAALTLYYLFTPLVAS